MIVYEVKLKDIGPRSSKTGFPLLLLGLVRVLQRSKSSVLLCIDIYEHITLYIKLDER